MLAKKAVLFDLDGTVLDTIGDIAAALNRALAAYGYGAKTVAQVQGYLGNGSLMLVRRATDFTADDSLCLEIRSRFADEYRQDMYGNTVAYAGVAALFDLLLEKGVRIGIITNKDHRCALPMIKHYFGNRVSAVLGVSGDTDRKPNPKNTLSMLEQWGISPQEAVFVGDGIPDMQVAQNCNIDFIPVGYGYTDAELLFSESGKVPVVDVEELRRKLAKLI